VIASQAHHANIPGSSLGSTAQKTDVEYIGQLSADTYATLPPSFQAIARNLAQRGEISIENTPVRVAESRDHDGRHRSI